MVAIWGGLEEWIRNQEERRWEESKGREALKFMKCLGCQVALCISDIRMGRKQWWRLGQIVNSHAFCVICSSLDVILCWLQSLCEYSFQMELLSADLMLFHCSVPPYCLPLLVLIFPFWLSFHILFPIPNLSLSQEIVFTGACVLPMHSLLVLFSHL